MDILIRYFDHVEDRVKVRYLDSKFFRRATHQDLFIQFTQALFKLDTNKMFQVSMDGPIVNLKFLENLQKDCSENEQHELISEAVDFVQSMVLLRLELNLQAGTSEKHYMVHIRYYMIHLPVEMTSKP